MLKPDNQFMPGAQFRALSDADERYEHFSATVP
jgi:hypothetical protein